MGKRMGTDAQAACTKLPGEPRCSISGHLDDARSFLAFLKNLFPCFNYYNTNNLYSIKNNLIALSFLFLFPFMQSYIGHG